MFAKTNCTLGINLQVEHALFSKVGSSLGSKGSSGVCFCMIIFNVKSAIMCDVELFPRGMYGLKLTRCLVRGDKVGPGNKRLLLGVEFASRIRMLEAARSSERGL